MRGIDTSLESMKANTTLSLFYICFFFLLNQVNNYMRLDFTKTGKLESAMKIGTSTSRARIDAARTTITTDYICSCTMRPNKYIK